MRALVVVLVLGLGPAAVSSSYPSRPPRQLACRTTDDCGFTHFGETCLRGTAGMGLLRG